MSRGETPIIEQVLAAVPAALAFVAADGCVRFENDRMAALPAALRGRALHAAATARPDALRRVEHIESDGGQVWRFEFQPAAEAGALVVVGTDVTASRRLEAQLEELLAFEQSARALTEYEKLSLVEEKALLEQAATRDALTGLANRRALDAAVDEALAAAADAGLSVALLYIDLDGFKHINDTFGHAIGDEVLVHVAARLRACIRGEDVAGRLGGDEFVLLLSGLPADAARDVTERVAARTLEVLRTPIDIDGATQRVGASIGLAIAEPGAVDAEALITAADAAMYRAKRAGGHTVFHVSVTCPERV
jgi:diguanylate cyclase (GGDEF)-like protein